MWNFSWKSICPPNSTHTYCRFELVTNWGEVERSLSAPGTGCWKPFIPHLIWFSLINWWRKQSLKDLFFHAVQQNASSIPHCIPPTNRSQSSGDIYAGKCRHKPDKRLSEWNRRTKMVSWVTVGCGRSELALLELAWEAITKKAAYLCLEVWKIWERGISLNPIKQSLPHRGVCGTNGGCL